MQIITSAGTILRALVTIWMATIHDNYGSNVNDLWYLVAEIYTT